MGVEPSEEVLWEKGLLGDHTPQVLIDTMVYCMGLYFALRSGEEHRRLCYRPSQIELVTTPNGKEFLRYKEDISKNNQAGLKQRKLAPKEVQAISVTKLCVVILMYA